MVEQPGIPDPGFEKFRIIFHDRIRGGDREKTGTPPVAARHTIIFGALDDLVGHEPERSEAFGLG